MLEMLERLDLTEIHATLALLGAVLAVVTSYTIMHDMESQRDCAIVRYGRRWAYPCLALCLIWAASYSHDRSWQPWPPDLFLIGIMDVILFLRMLSFYVRPNPDSSTFLQSQK